MTASLQKYQLTTLKTRKKINLFVLLLPALLFLVLFFAFPLLLVLLYSFLERGTKFEFYRLQLRLTHTS